MVWSKGRSMNEVRDEPIEDDYFVLEIYLFAVANYVDFVNFYHIAVVPVHDKIISDYRYNVFNDYSINYVDRYIHTILKEVYNADVVDSTNVDMVYSSSNFILVSEMI